MSFFTWVKRYRENVSRESETGKGFTYALNQEPYLRAFLKDARIPLDNNAAERAIRPFTVGRKKWIMIDTIKGAQASVVLYSIVETCKANDIKIYEYIRYLLEELPKTIHDLTVEVQIDYYLGQKNYQITSIKIILEILYNTISNTILFYLYGTTGLAFTMWLY